MTPFKWTRTLPTEAGVYFFRQVGKDSTTLRPVPIILERNAIGLIVPASNWGVMEHSMWIRGVVEWIGPIAPPEAGS